MEPFTSCARQHNKPSTQWSSNAVRDSSPALINPVFSTPMSVMVRGTVSMPLMKASFSCPDMCSANGTVADWEVCSQKCKLEEGCACTAPYVMCELGGCIHPGKLCDGVEDCLNGTEEMACNTEADVLLEEPNFHCGHSKEITVPLRLVNDLVPDCPYPNYADESRFLLFLRKGQPYSCDINKAPCFEGYDVCYNRHDICTYDRTITGEQAICRNGAHLAIDQCVDHQCSSMFKCPNSYCVPYHLMCDGVGDCPNHEDEADCHHPTLSCPFLFKCRGENRCVHPHNLLDGVEQCRKYGDDEKVFSHSMCPLHCTCISEGLSCEGVPLEKLPSFSASATVFYLHKTRLPLDVGTFSKYGRLKVLDISANQYTDEDIAPLMFLSQNQLQSLNLSHNELTEVVSEMFDGLNNLRTLDLSFNRLTRFVYTFKFCQIVPSLSSLNLQNNQIKAFDALEICEESAKEP